MRALIADDEPHLAAHLNARLKALWPELDILPVAPNGEVALTRMLVERPEIAFLDIRMPGLSGLEVAAGLDYPCQIVFVTAYDQYAVDAFERAAADYLLKPVEDDRLRRTVTRLKASAGRADAETLRQLGELLGHRLSLLHATPALAPSPPPRLNWIKAQSGDTVRLVAVEEVIYFQAADKYTLVMTTDAELLIRTSIKELVEQLDPVMFWQVDRGTLVNARQIEAAHQDSLGRVSLRLHGRTERLKVSRSHAHLFKQM